MSTYEEFMVILTTAILIVAILEYVNHNLKMPRYANTRAFQIDTIRIMIYNLPTKPVYHSPL